MKTTHTTHLLDIFNAQVALEFNQIENIELKIILALGDLLEEPNEHEENFINKSLGYLKEHYYLTKSVWKVLLKLEQEVPNFIDKLSKWENLTYIHYNGMDILNGFNETCYQIGFDDYKLFNSNREFNIFKLFKLINLMCQHFTIEQVTNYVGLFVKDFDNKKSSFSPNNLYNQSLHLKTIEADDRIYNNSINFFINTFSLLDNINFNLKSLHFAGLDLKYDRFKNTNKFVMNCLNNSFLRMNITHINSLEKYQTIMNTYHKYTNEEFISAKGLLEVRNKPIIDDEQKTFALLFKLLDKSHNLNLIKYKTTICLLKLISSYENNVIKGLEKLTDLNDYVINLNNIVDIEYLLLENRLDLKNLLALSHNWEKQGISRGEKIVYKDYGIDCNIGDYKFEQIKNSHDLHEEGKTQSHCVYHYNQQCEKEKSIIISMKDLNSNRISTIRLAKENIVKIFFKRKNKNIWYLAENRKRFNNSCNIDEKIAANKYFAIIKDKLI